MRYQKILTDLTLSGIRVFFYCIEVRREEWSYMRYGNWYGMNIDNARKSWNDGVKCLREKGYWVEDKWTEKARQMIKERDERDEGD